MTLNYNCTGSDRKRLVTSISEITESQAKYLGAPTFSYQVADCTIDKNGSVTCVAADNKFIGRLIDQLSQKGFVCEEEVLTETPDDVCQPPAETPQGETVGLTVAMPLDKEAVGNLTRLLEAKGNLIKKALGIETLPIDIGEDSVSFPWFEDGLDADTVKAYTHLIAALCEMSRNQKRIVATEKEVDNEKYAFRCLLLRLGFIGAEYKTERKILLKKLSGSSAFKSGNPKVQEMVDRINNDADLYDDVMALQNKEVSGDEVSE